MSLDAEERASIIAQMMKKKFGTLLDWQREVLVHDFGSNNLDQVDRFEGSLAEIIEFVQNAFEQMSDKALETAGAQLADPRIIKESDWGSLLTKRIAKAHRAVPSPIVYGFGHPKYIANFAHWARMPELSLHEVTSLSLGADPRHIGEEDWIELKNLQDDNNTLWAAHRSFLEQRDIFRRCFHFTGFGYVAEPIRRIKHWIDDLDINVHPDFYKGLEARTQPKLVKDAEGERTDLQLLSKELKHQEVETLLKLIAAMAIKGYAFKAGAKRNQATADIQSDLDTLGISLDPKTILKWVRAACDIVPKDQP